MGLPWAVGLMVSTLWIVYRVFLVFQKPTEELEEVLGIDIPPVPDVTLSKITGNSVLLYWKPPENYHSPLKHLIQVNGINVGEFDRSDATIQITGLQPGNYYGIRAVATNNTGNPSYSTLKHVQTVPPDGHRGQKLLANADQSRVLSMRSAPGRRVSQPLPPSVQEVVQTAPEEARDKDHDETIENLTKRLDALKQQKEEAEAQLAADFQDAEKAKAELIKERDNLKQMVEEKEKASLEFKKQVHKSEKLCSKAQQKKSEKDRILKKKKADRQKAKDDMARWEEERSELEENMKILRKQKAELEGTHEKKMEEAQKIIEKAQADSARMEDELHELGIKVKVIEEERARAAKERNAEEEEAERRERDEEQLHDRTIQDLQNQYAALWKATAQSEANAQIALEHLALLLDAKARDPTAFAPIAGLDYPLPFNPFQSSWSHRQNGLRGNSASLHSTAFSNHSTFNSTSSASPTFSSAFPFPGVASPGVITERVGMTQQEVENLSAGAPMSPSADTLLPSNLLHDDDDSRRFFNRARLGRGSVGSNAQIFQPPITEKTNQEPQSPQSFESLSGSIFSSPRESLSNIPGFYGRDPRGEDEARSIVSTESAFNLPQRAISSGGSSRKIGGLFLAKYRQRGDKGLAEPPALGTLKQGQSQSFPVNLDQNSALSTPGRRKGTGIWSNPMSNFLARGVLKPSEALENASPRPSSTYSSDHGFSHDTSPFGWSTPDSARPRGGGLATERSSASGPWAQSQSRRQSNHYGSTSNLSIGSTPLDPATDSFSPFAFGGKNSQPAPIGIERFRASQQAKAPKLNPSAPSFTARFFNRESKKASKLEKPQEFGSDKAKSRDGESNGELDTPSSRNSSPPTPRLSQDTHSIATDASMGESHHSLEPSISASHSDIAGSSSSSAPKETLMQRLTRKSSSAKFTAPFFKDRNGKTGPSSRKEPSTPDESNEDAGSDYLSRSVDSAASTPQHDRIGTRGGSLRWSNFMGKGKGKQKDGFAPAAPSSETSDAWGSEAEAEAEETGTEGDEP